jgi:hypothetical protein
VIIHRGKDSQKSFEKAWLTKEKLTIYTSSGIKKINLPAVDSAAFSPARQQKSLHQLRMSVH